MIFPFFNKSGFLGIFGPPYCNIGATIRIGREMLCLRMRYFWYLVWSFDIDTWLTIILYQVIYNDLYVRCGGILNDIQYHTWHPMIFVSGENIYTWYIMFVVSGVKLFLFLYYETWHPMILVSGEKNHTWHQMFLVSGVKLLIIIYCETWHPMVLVSGENNHTWYPVFLVSGATWWIMQP